MRVGSGSERTESVVDDAGDMGVIGAILTLTKFATSNDAVDVDVEVQLEAGGPWRAIQRGREPLEDNRYPLLDPRHLTAEKFAARINFRTHTGGLDAAVVDDLGGVAVQAQVLTLCSIAEGLHRRLFASGGKRVKALSDRKIAKIRRSVREAALGELDGTDFAEEDRDEFCRAITEAFAHINEQTFRSRMSDLLLDAQRTIPSLGAGFADWPGALSSARNRLAHQPSAPDSASDKQFLDLLVALSYSIAWVLRTNLLNKAGFDVATMREAYGDSSRYGHHLANTRMLLAGGPWAADVNH